MSELVINESRMTCCGLTRNECTCRRRRQPVVNEDDFEEPPLGLTGEQVPMTANATIHGRDLLLGDELTVNADDQYFVSHEELTANI